MNAATTPPMVNLEDMRVALESASTLVIDIREPHEHANGVASGAVLIPMSQLGDRLAELPEPGGKPFWLICNTQMRSANVVAQLQNMGYTNASYVNGGMSLWARQAWPMVKP
jgi:rhodanese-related sulfurtransferase